MLLLLTWPTEKNILFGISPPTILNYLQTFKELFYNTWSSLKLVYVEMAIISWKILTQKAQSYVIFKGRKNHSYAPTFFGSK